MKINIRYFIISLSIFLMFFSVKAVPAEMTGRQIMDKQKELHKVKTEVGFEVMLLVDKDGSKEKRTSKRFGKELEEDENRFLFVFLSPADIAGTAVLTWEHKKGENDQWLYMPATKKLQRIASGSKKNYFMGTDFTYEDMEPEDMDDFRYTVLRSETIKHDKKDQVCWVVEAVPANDQKAKESGYSKRIMWIEKNHYTTLKIEFYDKRGGLLKTQTNHAFENVKGTVYRAKKTFMRNHSNGHKTLTLVRKREVDTDIDEMVFTERYILTGKHVQ